jgi:hypothetical protein
MCVCLSEIKKEKSVTKHKISQVNHKQHEQKKKNANL